MSGRWQSGGSSNKWGEMRPLRAPIKVSLDLTYRCPLRCRHCRVGEAGPQRTLTLDEVLRVVEDLASIGVFRIAFSGGEPFLRKDIVEIIRHTLAVSPGRVFVSTSGVAFTDRTLVALHPLRGRLTFKISLDGPPAIHNAIRGWDGAFAIAYDTISECAQVGFSVQVTTTLMHDNVRFVEETMELVRRTGCTRHYLVELIPAGRATQEMALTWDERLHLQQTIARTRKRLEREGYTVVVRIPFLTGAPAGLMCSAGINECGILADGHVVGCRLLPKWVAGNVRERLLSEIWADPEAFSEFRRLTARDCGETCAACPVAESCRGGCRAYAAGMTGDFYVPDSRCPVACPNGEQHVRGAL